MAENVEYTVEQLEEMLKKKKQAQKSAQKSAQAQYENRKNAFVKRMVDLFHDYNKELTDLKKEVLTEGNALHDEMYKVYGKEPKELKQFTLFNEAKTLKLVIERQNKLQFDETAEVAINTIKDVLRSKFEGRNKSMYKIIDGILMKNNKGDYDERLVSKLRKYEEDVNDNEFSSALDLLAKSYNVVGSATYARAYTLNHETNKWLDITIQFSAL